MSTASKSVQWPSEFPALRQSINGHPLTYLDSAATTLRPQSVIDALVEFYSGDNANPTRMHSLGARSADRLADARQTLARFINAPEASEVIFVRGTTEGVNLLATTFGPTHLEREDQIILTVSEHASNTLAWTRLARQQGARLSIVDVDDNGHLRLDHFERLLKDRTRIVSFAQVSNVLGYVNPAKEMCAMARRAGAYSVVDGAQGAPHVSVDVQDLGCDFYVFSGHKMLGPMATGVVWGRRELLDAMPPYHAGSNMAHAVDFESAEIEHGALKFQAGTPDVAGPVGLTAAVRFFEAAGADAIARQDRTLVEYALTQLPRINGLRIVGPTRPEHRAPVITFTVDGHAPDAIARRLDAQGIAIRAGDLAAVPLLRRFGITSAARASAYLYSTTDDIDRLCEGLRSLKA